MVFATKSTSATHTYTYAGGEINLFSDDETGLTVTIDTERLHLQSVQATATEYDRYAALFGDTEVMNKFYTGETRSRDQVEDSIKNIWARRWRERDPYSGMAISEQEVDRFVGHIGLDHTGEAGVAELSYLLHRAAWGQRYGTEAATVVVKEYAPLTAREGYTLDGEPLARIKATARLDNPASCRILEGVGMHLVETKEAHGALRHHYTMDVGH
ncbi:MAG: GNAT family N-acetyltransferase [Verrucomicrobia bacterium]|nr:GNAT family N-acetyltransferase [Verrucomicrobiota bacterium]